MSETMCLEQDFIKIRDEIVTKLQVLEIPFRLLDHEALFTCDDALKYRKETRGSGCKNLFFCI